jgi:hypothetical protein
MSLCINDICNSELNFQIKLAQMHITAVFSTKFQSKIPFLLTSTDYESAIR